MIYDLERNKAHCLNKTAARVWKHCDGKTTLSDACALLSREFGENVDEKIVCYAVDQFAKDNLLEQGGKFPAFIIAGMNRRQMVRALGLAAAIALPLVTSIMAPTPAQAATLFPSGSPCTAPAQCLSGICCTAPGVCDPAIPVGTCS